MKTERDAALPRCEWSGLGDDDMLDYHDEVWGRPEHDDRALFELLTLQVFQAGLSWRLILSRADAFRTAFDDFDIATVAGYGDPDVDRLLDDASIIRNRRKIEATIDNAAAACAAIARDGSFDAYLWGFVDAEPIVNEFESLADLPAKTPAAEAMGRQMKHDGFKFTGPTVMYAFMQAAGLVNDHTIDCFRHAELTR